MNNYFCMCHNSKRSLYSIMVRFVFVILSIMRLYFSPYPITNRNQKRDKTYTLYTKLPTYRYHQLSQCYTIYIRYKKEGQSAHFFFFFWKEGQSAHRPECSWKIARWTLSTIQSINLSAHVVHKITDHLPRYTYLSP